MSRLRILQAWIATAVVCTGVAVVPGMAARVPRPLRERLAMPCAARSTRRRESPGRLRSCLREERREVRSGRRRQGVYP